MKTFDINGKTALVTGANRGIGKAFVEALSSRGAKKIYAGTRDRSNFDGLQQLSPIVEPVVLDVTRAEDIQTLSSNISTLDLLINNAGIANACTPAADNAMDIARLEMETNYFGPLKLVLSLLPLLKQSHGAIINISSIAGISNFPSLGPYSATKAALHSWTQGLRAELESSGILVAGVYPGPIETRMTEGFEIEKAPASQVADKTLDAIARGELDIFPDHFSEQMYSLFLKHPSELEKAFATML